MATFFRLCIEIREQVDFAGLLNPADPLNSIS
jgi:hypothetical protein